ncbi:hypothetical protein AVEN_67707-1 [Araneus ventricosus]|uniref:Uncharacterized protein n=1 Tax=Araneus ventricosus TaxID=182803 RepID=A0A4Y2I4P0_ARAVE|nr:hypothetical protein AVEN_67707-1 [Araneus ventricosus]
MHNCTKDQNFNAPGKFLSSKEKEKPTENIGSFRVLEVRLGYINVPFLKQHEGYLGTDLGILNRGQVTRTTPELVPAPSPNFRATPTGGRLAITYDLACGRPHTRRIFGGIRFRGWDPPVLGSRLYH